MRFRLQIPQGIYEEMLNHARAEAPNECVGFLAGSPDGLVSTRLPLVNALADPRRFLSEPRSLFEAERHRQRLGLELLAVYHSHPTGPATPSRIDTDPGVNYWLGMDVVSVIVSLQPPRSEVRAFWLHPHRFEPAEMIVLPS
jgi:proteasome lid subunit RPN8/RPN11